VIREHREVGGDRVAIAGSTAAYTELLSELVAEP
jgi:hypothetical protein